MELNIIDIRTTLVAGKRLAVYIYVNNMFIRPSRDDVLGYIGLSRRGYGDLRGLKLLGKHSF